MIFILFTVLEDVDHSLSHISAELFSSGSTSSGSFEWYDSVLVEAVTRGRWLLIENAHVCGASVLDRLNSLLEPGGSLTVTERGVVEGEAEINIKPHPNFRCFRESRISLVTPESQSCHTS